MKAQDVDTLVNEFRKFGGSEVRNMLLKIMKRFLKREKFLAILGKP